MIQLFFQLNFEILFVLLLFGLVIGKTRKTAISNFSRKSSGFLILDFFNLVGIPVHELGHLVFGLLFGYHIDKICLYRTTKKSLHCGGTLGFVKMHHKKNTFFQKLQANIGQFFIGIGPLLSGPAIIFVTARLLPHSIRTLPNTFHMGSEIFLKSLQQLKGSDIIFLLVFLYLLIGISLNLELSREDLHLAFQGLFFLEILFFLFSALAVLFHWNPETGIHVLFRWNLIISCIGIISSLFTNLISFL